MSCRLSGMTKAAVNIKLRRIKLFNVLLVHLGADTAYYSTVYLVKSLVARVHQIALLQHNKLASKRWLCQQKGRKPTGQ